MKRWRRRSRASVAVGTGKGLAWRQGDRAEADWHHIYQDECNGLFRGTEDEFGELAERLLSERLGPELLRRRTGMG